MTLSSGDGDGGSSTSMKVLIALIGSGILALLIGVIFWMGSTYNRIQGIELHLSSIDTVVSKMGDIQLLDQRVADHERRLGNLEGEIYGGRSVSGTKR